MNVRMPLVCLAAMLLGCTDVKGASGPRPPRRSGPGICRSMRPHSMWPRPPASFASSKTGWTRSRTWASASSGSCRSFPAAAIHRTSPCPTAPAACGITTTSTPTTAPGRSSNIWWPPFTRGMYVMLDWVPNHTAWGNNLLKTHPEFYRKDSTGRIVQAGPWADVAQLDMIARGTWPASSLDRFLNEEKQSFPAGATRMRHLTNHDMAREQYSWFNREHLDKSEYAFLEKTPLAAKYAGGDRPLPSCAPRCPRASR